MFYVLIGCTSTSTNSSPFKGEWKLETADEINLLKINLNEKIIMLPDESNSCFGYLQTENEFVADYWIIDEVTNITKDSANIKVYSWRYGSPQDKQDRVLHYNFNDNTITVKQDGYNTTLYPIKNNL